MKNIYKKHKIISFILLLFIAVIKINAQQSDSTLSDTLKASQVDENSKINKFLKKKLYKESKVPVKAVEIPFEKSVVNKPIRNVIINSHDPFGYSLQDTTKQPTKWIERAGNSLHGKTKPFVLREALLFKKGDKLDSLKVKESERLLRARRLFRKVEIVPVLTNNKDSVDVYVNTIDTWSMVVTGSLSTSKAGIQIRERNFFGLGHVFLNRYRHNYKTGKKLYHFNYTVPNIAKTRIIGNVNYFTTEDEHYNKSISFARPFYSPLAKWAGGVGFGQVFYQDSLDFSRDDLKYYNFKYNYSDVWAAKAFRIGENRKGMISNLVVSGRYYERSYKETPEIDADPYNFFSDQQNYFLGVGISSKKYHKDNFIYNTGIDEDVAEGYVLGLTGAMQKREAYSRGYLGGKIAYGKYLKNKNYIGFDIEYGSFFRNKFAEQTTFTLNMLYFSHLLNFNKWKIRQFSKLNYTLGGHRWDTPADKISLNQNDYMGIDGIRKARNLLGNQKFILEFQTQTYSPYEFLGFRISPFFNAAFGLIGNNKETFLDKDNSIVRLGLGVLFTNDYFVFNNIRFSFSYFPRIPGENPNAIKTNIIDNRDFELMDYSFDKPSYIRWNRWD